MKKKNSYKSFILKMFCKQIIAIYSYTEDEKNEKMKRCKKHNPKRKEKAFRLSYF